MAYCETELSSAKTVGGATVGAIVGGLLVGGVVGAALGAFSGIASAAYKHPDGYLKCRACGHVLGKSNFPEQPAPAPPKEPQSLSPDELKRAGKNAIGCLAVITWIVLFLISAMKNMTICVYVIIIPPIIIGAVVTIKYIKSLLIQQEKQKAYCVIAMMAILIVSALMVPFLGNGCKKSQPSRTAYVAPPRIEPTATSRTTIISQSQVKITESQVKQETQAALRLAAQKSGLSVYGFCSDHILIGDTSATCHFHCFSQGKRYDGGIEFSIINGKLIPSGKYYLDEN